MPENTDQKNSKYDHFLHSIYHAYDVLTISKTNEKAYYSFRSKCRSLVRANYMLETLEPNRIKVTLKY